MDKITLNQHPGYSGLLWVTPDMVQFVDHVITLYSNFVSFGIGLVNAGYYNAPDPRGEYGWIGPRIENKTNYDENVQTFNLRMKVSKIHKDLYDLCNELKITPGYDQIHKSLFINDVYNYKDEEYIDYYCKKNGFDDVYHTITKYTDFTQKNFENTDIGMLFTEKSNSPPANPADLLDISRHGRMIRTDLNYYNIKVSIIGIDIRTNQETLLKIIDCLYQYKID